MSGCPITNRKVHHAARAKSNKDTIGGQLHSVDQLAFAVDDVVDRTRIDVLTRANPEISLGVGTS